jgi:NifU-like protein involved in Fe-S cluster formation
MDDELQKRVAAAIQNPQNVGEMSNADATGVVGSAGCGDLMQLWIKFKEANGQRVIDRATFQSFGCETAIAVASLATELIRGKTPEEALAMSSQDLAGQLGPLPPLKVHCAQLVEKALRSALSPEDNPPQSTTPGPAAPPSNLLDSFTHPSVTSEKDIQIVLFDPSKK